MHLLCPRIFPGYNGFELKKQLGILAGSLHQGRRTAVNEFGCHYKLPDSMALILSWGDQVERPVDEQENVRVYDAVIDELTVYWHWPADDAKG